uniref:uncharacterized protein n=1 Tax=Pristiophorus japonicus TaxID=55135 RepID=UPI00398E74DD
MDPSLEMLKISVRPLQLTALAVWSAVARHDFKCYGRVVEFLETVNGSVPNLVAFRHFAKLVLGLKAKFILEMFLQHSRPDDIRSTLEQFFPERAPAHTMATPRDSQKVRQIQQQFRELVFYLLTNPQFRDAFLQEEVQEQYGEQFLDVLQKLLWEYLTRLGGALPRVPFDQLREVAQTDDTSAPPREQFLIGCLKELDPESLQLLGANLVTSHPQGQVALVIPSAAGPGDNFRDAGGRAFPAAWRSPRPRGIAASPCAAGEDGRAPRVREEGGKGSGREAAPAILFASETTTTSRRRSRSVAGGETPGRPPTRPDLRLSPLRPPASGGREARGSGAGGRTAVGNGALRQSSGSDPAPELPRPPRLKRHKRKVGVRGHGPQCVPGAKHRHDDERTSPSASPPCLRRLRSGTKEKENTATSRWIHSTRRRLDVAGPSDRLLGQHQEAGSGPMGFEPALTS